VKIKEIIIIFACIITAYLVIAFTQETIKKLASPIPSIPPLPSEIPTRKPQINEITLNGKTYQFHFHKIENGETLKLIPNFQEATFSAQIVKRYECDFGINGGFYKKEGGPLGLFFADQKLFGEKIQSTTFNGFLGKKKDGSLIIFNPTDLTYFPDYPNSPYSFLLQSGPLIFLKNEVQPNFIDRDFSRRHLIAKSTMNEFYLFSIFEKDNKFNGPRLEDLRPIYLSPDFKTIADFDLILNLDGGSASAFYDRGVQVEEFKQIGSFLCGKQL
jgi:uncharacterized protein YigE (DUF2233 family)